MMGSRRRRRGVIGVVNSMETRLSMKALFADADLSIGN